MALRHPCCRTKKEEKLTVFTKNPMVGSRNYRIITLNLGQSPISFYS